MAKRVEGHVESVWVEFGRMAAENQAVNLGQGFPDFFPPSFVTESIKDVANSSNPFSYQYTRGYGNPRLVKAVAELYTKLMGRPVDLYKEILITCGAYESLFCAHQGLVNPGDEVIIIEPFFDCYEPMIKVCGGVPVAVPLRPTKNGKNGSVLTSEDWKLDVDELSSKFNKKTKAIIVNNPNNPLGKVFSLEELQMISELCIKHNVICISDEVYEWLVYKPKQHIRIATLPGMWDRTVTIGSAGKTFSVTGWKTGWSIGPQHLINAMCMIHQNSVYTCITPIQEAVANCFEHELKRMDTPQGYWNELPAELLPKRDMMAAFLAEVGMVPTIPEGGYFMLADISNIDFKEDPTSSEMRDSQFVKWLTKNKKLATIPTSVFYMDEHKHLAKNLVRFCFIKEDSTLEKAAGILREWKKSSSS